MVNKEQDLKASGGGYAFVSAIWPSLPPEDFTAMQKQYSQLIQHFDHEMETVRGNSDFFAIHGQTNTLELMQKLNSTDQLTRAQALDQARGVCPGEKAVEKLLRSIDLAVRLWLTIDVSSLDLRRQGLVIWTSEATLDGAIESYFTNMENSSLPRKRQFTADDIPPTLTAELLVNNYGYTVSWTSNLADHLSIDWKHKIITIYEHKICLYNHLRFQDNCGISHSVLEDALDTLNLLFPFQDDATKRFLVKHKKPFYGLGFCGRPRKLDLSEYQHWQGRVSDLVYLASGPPVGLQQLRLDKDRRNLLSFATFWIATGVGVLTLVSIAFGIAATVYGVMQYNLALKQYQLSVAQACLDPAARVQLPDFCS
ncbi:hypothetical protein GQ53DRAFT_723424 [Thozetella sp. PMI_491]|nr:hypothetical protein GQ53DRAFT_723424 [Thozetella sp. PMI_491]